MLDNDQLKAKQDNQWRSMLHGRRLMILVTMLEQSWWKYAAALPFRFHLLGEMYREGCGNNP